MYENRLRAGRGRRTLSACEDRQGKGGWFGTQPAVTLDRGTLTGHRNPPAGSADRIYGWRSEGCGRGDARKVPALDRGHCMRSRAVS